MKDRNEYLREVVRNKYAELAGHASAGTGSCCDGPAMASSEVDMIGDAYEGVQGYMPEADLGLSCGVPVEHAGLKAGQRVLDLGSGAGLDVFVARSEVGPDGHVIGVDMTAEMVARARRNAANSDYDNVEFRLGEIEHLPVRSDSIDVVLSNCVLNLVPDKLQAFREIQRVLKPGGHFCISDIVASAPLPDWVQGIADAYAGCVSGAIPRGEYLRLVRQAGFTGVRVESQRRIDIPASLLESALSPEQRKQAERDDLHVMSVTVTAYKPE
jgi:ubiquinone/menaquinone biosynthesis C-methylase UbiE